MPRRTFTARDIRPLRRATERVLKTEPDAALVAAAAGPFKRKLPKSKVAIRSEVRLPVEVESSSRPEGVPLSSIADELRKEVPEVTGVSVTPGGVTLKFLREPTEAQRRKAQEILADAPRLQKLRPVIRSRGAPLARGLGDDDVLRILKDPQTSDAAWLKAFRRYAVDHLLERGEEK